MKKLHNTNEKCEEIPSENKTNEENKHEEVELIEIDKQSTLRPKRGSLIRFRKINGEEKDGKVKQVGKKTSRDKNVCWIVTNEGTESIDFSSEVAAWIYKEKNTVTFDSEVKENISEHLLNKVKGMDAFGVFLLQRAELVEVLASMVPTREYQDPYKKLWQMSLENGKNLVLTK